jgi:hypothetical protein
MEYRVSAKCTDDLANADVEINVQVFGKTSLTILLNSRHSMRIRCGTEINVVNKVFIIRVKELVIPKFFSRQLNFGIVHPGLRINTIDVAGHKVTI